MTPLPRAPAISHGGRVHRPERPRRASEVAPRPEQPITHVMDSANRKVTRDAVDGSFVPSETNAGQPRPGAWGEGMGIGGRQ